MNYLFDDWAISLSNIIDDIEHSKEKFDDGLYNELETYFNSEIQVDKKYISIANEIKWDKYNKSRRNKITLRLMLDAFRDKKTHSIKNDSEVEYKLFYLSVTETNLIALFNCCSKMIDDRTKNCLMMN